MEKSLDARVIDDYLVKKPFVRISPDYFGGYGGIPVTTDRYSNVPHEKIAGELMTQANFLREYYVSGHKINSDMYYPDIIKKDENGNVVVEAVSRAAFPFQQIIATKQLIHLTGNPIRIEDSSISSTMENKRTLVFFRQGWRDKNMEVAFFKMINSVKTTGDGALCFFYGKNGLGCKLFSFLEGDTLYMHYDQFTGEKKLFVRTYSMYDDQNREVREYAEAWDKTYMYRFVKEKAGIKGLLTQVGDTFGKSGWKMTGSPTPHGFSSMPIVYHRESDVCWADSQKSIEMYEVAVSQLCENNKAYAFPILFVKGGDLEFKGRVDGRPYAIISDDAAADAKTINRADASESFKLQLDILLKNIFMGSFTVLPPEVKAGDLPGVAVKLMYSPAVEKAMRDAKIFDHIVDEMMDLFSEGYGKETKEVTAFGKLKAHGTIEPYVHQNISEIMQNLFTGVTGGFLSKETASEIVPYGKNDEYKRLLNQVRQEIMGVQNENYEGKTEGSGDSGI